MFSLINLPGCYSFGANGVFQSCDPSPEVVASVVLRGGEDVMALEHGNTPSGRKIAFDPYAERDQPLNPLGTQFLGFPAHGTVVVLPVGS